VAHATQPTLHQRPEALDGVGMNVSTHVDVRRVLNPAMVIALGRKRVVGRVLVRVDSRSRQYPALDVRRDGLDCYIGNSGRVDVALRWTIPRTGT
jgi:hypothetical protein